SSRRRHTRCLSDWSSDVCSSDLSTMKHCGKEGFRSLFLAWRAKRRHARKRERIPSFPQCFMVECGPRLALVKGRRGMVICDRLRALRGEKKLSQGDIEKRTGLLRCYISRVENGHTVPTVETLEKMARALEV